MVRHIIAYSDLRYFRTTEEYIRIRECPHIAIQSNLARGFYGENDLDKFPYISIHDLCRDLIPEWFNDYTKMCLTVSAKCYLRLKVEVARENKDAEEIHWLRGCRKSVEDIVSALMFLEENEIDVYCLDEASKSIDAATQHENTNRNIRLLIELWQQLLDEDPHLRYLTDMFRQLSDKSVFEKKLREIFPYEFSSKTNKTVVIHGFYYITAVQERIFRLFEKHGYDLIFLIHYDENNKEIFTAWEHTLSGKEFDPEWVFSKPDVKQDSVFREILFPKYGNPRKELIENISIRKYTNAVEFARFVEKNPEYHLISPAPGDANDILDSFIPGKYRNRRLLQYPIGHFIMELLDTWDPDYRESPRSPVKPCCTIKPEKMGKFIDSGWLKNTKNIPKQKLLSIYRRISTFFEDCLTSDEWAKRLKKLETNRTEIREKYGSGSDWISLSSNPYSFIGPYSISDNEFDAINETISGYLKIVNRVFPHKRQKVTIKSYLNYLYLALFEDNPPQIHNSPDTEILMELIGKLSSVHDENAYYPEDMCEAVTYYLGGKLEDEEDSVQECSVLPLNRIDGLYATDETSVHLCLADMDRLPGSKSSPPWPLTPAIYSRMNSNGLDKSGLLKYSLYQTEDQVYYARYLMYCLSKVKHSLISWVAELNDISVQESPYVRILENHIPKSNLHLYPEKPIITPNPNSCQKQIVWGKVRYNDVPREYKIEATLCPYRYVYGFLLQEHPEYHSEFHMEHMLTAVIAYLTSGNEVGSSENKAYSELMKKMFPSATQYDIKYSISRAPAS